MTLQPVKDIGEYKRLKDTLRQRFESERTGDQELFREQTRILQPLINTQNQTTKAIEGQDTLVRELQRRNDLDMLATQPFFNAPTIPAIAQAGAPQPLKIDLDAGLDDTDRENLQDMSFELPSIVFKNKTIEEVLEKIKTENRSIGQRLGKTTKLPTKDVEAYNSRKETLQNYKQILLGLEGAKQFVSTPKKVGKGYKKYIQVIYYPTIDDLCFKLVQLHSAKEAGHTGLDNNINAILDELLRVKAIDKPYYDNLYKSIFNSI
jgi:hypothetical protein